MSSELSSLKNLKVTSQKKSNFEFFIVKKLFNKITQKKFFKNPQTKSVPLPKPAI